MKIQIPTTCPCCDYPLETVGDQLFCRNSACSAQIGKKIEHFTKVLAIKGFGPKTVQKLGLNEITEIFYLDRIDLIEALGSEKVADKLLNEIERSKSATLETVLASFSIPLIGETAAKKIVAVVSNLNDLTQEKCKEAGLGDKATANLMTWFETEYPDLKEFLPFTFKSSGKTTNTGPTVCITGKLKSYKTKSEATKLLEAAGFVVTESLTKTTSYLVDEQGNGSSKRKKADEYGIIIIHNLNEFLKET